MVKKTRIASKPNIPKSADEWVSAGGLDPDSNIVVNENVATWNFKFIQDRDYDTREINQSHVNSLADSIAVLGLIEPLVIDKNGKLLAGGHRKAAIALLAELNPPAYKKHFPENLVPVRVINISSDENPDHAIEIEISENELRKDYSKAEILAIAERLRQAGYKDSPGRPKKGEKRLKPALSTIFGKSIRTVERYLAEETPSNGEVFNSSSDVHLKKALTHLETWHKTRGKTKKEQALAKKILELKSLMEEVLGNRS